MFFNPETIIYYFNTHWFETYIGVHDVEHWTRGRLITLPIYIAGETTHLIIFHVPRVQWIMSSLTLVQKVIKWPKFGLKML